MFDEGFPAFYKITHGYVYNVLKAGFDTDFLLTLHPNCNVKGDDS